MPTALPENLAAQAISPRSFSLSWSAPDPEGRNGDITRYAILITANNVSSVLYSAQFTLELPTQGFTVIPYTTYFIQVAAETVKGRGPYSEQVAVYTPEDGKQTAVPPARLPQFLYHYSSLQSASNFWQFTTASIYF